MPQRSNSARYMWGDRNPAANHLVYNNTIPPAVWTERAAYTVPTGKKAQVMGGNVNVMVATVAAPAGVKECHLAVISGGNTYRMISAVMGADKNVVGNFDKMNVGLAYTLLAGEKAGIYTADASTGGTISYGGFALITEYDA